jgi:ribosome-associated protein
MQIKAEETIKNIVDFLYDKKATDVRIFNVKDLTSICDYIIITSSSNTTHVKSLTEDLKEFLDVNFIKRIEKDENFNWIVLDCDFLIIHIFHQNTREFYNLESLWSDAQEITFQ